MAKYYGRIGFATPVNDEKPGVTFDEIIERSYFGELTRNAKRVQVGDTINDDLSLSNQISLLLDPYLEKNFYNIRYLAYMGAKWKVTKVEVRYPRIIIDIGGLYAEQSIDSSQDFM